MKSIRGLRNFGTVLSVALAAVLGFVARAEGDPPSAARPGAPGAHAPSTKLACSFVLANASVSGLGTPVTLTLGLGRRVNAVFLGKQDRSDGVIWYFFDRDRRVLIWADESEVDFRGPRRGNSIRVDAQVGPTCFNTALGNCAAYVRRYGPVGKVDTPSSARLRSIVAEFNQAILMGADAGAAQDVFALRFLSAHGIGARFAKTNAELTAHLASGRPALVGLSVAIEDTNHTVRFHSGREFPGETPGGFLQTYVPGRGPAHEVLVLGRISTPTSRGFMDYFWVVADSKTGEILIWDEANALAARAAEAVLVDLD